MTTSNDSAERREANQANKYVTSAARNKDREIPTNPPAHTPTLRPPANLKNGDQALPNKVNKGVAMRSQVCSPNPSKN